MIKFLLFCILLVLCWPLALLALILYPIVWLVALPFRIVGVAVTGVFALITAIFLPSSFLDFTPSASMDLPPTSDFRRVGGSGLNSLDAPVPL